MIGRYDTQLITLSIFIAVIASFVALDMASRVAATRGTRVAPYWLGGGALAMGTGIWAMHFIGMLAFSLPVPVAYDIPITLASLLLAMGASALALHTVSLGELGWRRLSVAGIVMGVGIAGMHYLGMEAMRMHPRIRYDPLILTISVLIAIAASGAALWIASQLRRETILSAFRQKFASSLVMGAAITGMHYTGMGAANFADDTVCTVSGKAFDSIWLGGTIGGFAFLFLATTLLVSIYVAMTPTIRSRLIFLVIGCVLPISLMAVGFVIYDYHRSQAQQIDKSITTARATAALVDKELASIQSGLQVLATSPSLATGNYADFYAQARVVMRELQVTAITLSEFNGDQLIDTRQPFGSSLARQNTSEHGAKVFASGRPVISDLSPANQGSDTQVSIGVPVLRGQTVAYQISAYVSSERLSLILIGQNLPAEWLAVVYDGSGTTVARNREMSRFVGKKGPSAILRRMTQVEEGSIEITTLEGIPVVSTFSRSTASRWTVAIGVPTSTFAGQLLRSLGWLLLAVALLLAGSIALAWKIGGSISQSLHALTAPALALGQGEHVDVPLLGLKEADEIGKAISMASTLLEHAQYSAQHDGLTGLANRGLFTQIVLQQIEIAKRTNDKLAILYLDLDGFKAINDTHGHEIGDLLLKAVAARIQVNIRKCDIAARLGGDEFAIVLVSQGDDGTSIVAGKLVDAMTVAFPIDGRTLQISASIGAAIFPDSATSYDALLARADDAMYKAKKAGRRQYVIA